MVGGNRDGDSDGSGGRDASVGDKLTRLAAALPPELSAPFDALWHYRTVPAGTVLVEDGHAPDHLGYVLDGMLGMVKQLSDGRRHIIGLLVPTDLYGRLFEGQTGYQIEALTETRVMTTDLAAFEAILHQAPAAERLFIVDVLDELDAAREWVLVLGGPKVVQRVASFLLILCRRQLHGQARDEAGAPPQIKVRVPIRRSDLAQYLGARPESLSRAIHELSAAGIVRIDTPYDLEVLDLAGLIEIAGHDLVMVGRENNRRDADRA